MSDSWDRGKASRLKRRAAYKRRHQEALEGVRSLRTEYALKFQPYVSARLLPNRSSTVVGMVKYSHRQGSQHFVTRAPYSQASLRETKGAIRLVETVVRSSSVIDEIIYNIDDKKATCGDERRRVAASRRMLLRVEARRRRCTPLAATSPALHSNTQLSQS